MIEYNYYSKIELVLVVMSYIVIAIICSSLRSVYTSINQFDASMSCEPLALIGMISCKFVHILFVLYGTLHVTSKAW